MEKSGRFIIKMKEGSKLFLAKGGEYTPNSREAKTWRTFEGVIHYLNLLSERNPYAVWEEIKN